MLPVFALYQMSCTDSDYDPDLAHTLRRTVSSRAEKSGVPGAANLLPSRIYLSNIESAGEPNRIKSSDSFLNGTTARSPPAHPLPSAPPPFVQSIDA